jgi:hypothetical protein
MHALDGNAIAGELFAAFGHEMTAVVGTCTSCGERSAIAELRVYISGRGRPLPRLRQRRDGARAWQRPLRRLQARPPGPGGRPGGPQLMCRSCGNVGCCGA